MLQSGYFERLYAGIAPAIIPINIDAMNAPINNPGLKYEEKTPLFQVQLRFPICPITSDPIIPTNTPPIPPTKPSIPDLNKNIIKISLFLAPIAFIIPISFVFSSTDVNIVLETPIAPTNKEIAAIAQEILI